MDQAAQLRNIVKKNQQETENEKVARIITVTSGKGGVGKSNTAINLAIQFTKMGKKVVIFDADFGLANIEVMFGAIPKYNLSDLVYRGKKIQEIITKGPLDIDFISGGSGIDALMNLDNEQLSYLVQCLGELEKTADIIIIDTGAGISNHVLEFVISSQEVLLVTTPEPTSLTDAYSLLKALDRNPGYSKKNTMIKVIVNKVESHEEGRNLFHKLDTVVKRFLDIEISYLGIVPQDTNLTRAVMQQIPISMKNPAAKSARAYEALAAKLLNSGTKAEEGKRGLAEVFSGFLKKKIKR